MIAGTTEVVETIWRRLSATSKLTEDDRQPLLGLHFSVEEFAKRQLIAGEGTKPRRSCVILNGVTSRYQQTPDGERQIQAIQIQGDITDILSLHMEIMDHSLRTLSPCRLAFIAHVELRDLFASAPILAAAVWKKTLIDAAIFRASILRIARLNAAERVAHVLCELKMRYRASGVLIDDSFVLRMT